MAANEAGKCLPTNWARAVAQFMETTGAEEGVATFFIERSDDFAGPFLLVVRKSRLRPWTQARPNRLSFLAADVELKARVTLPLLLFLS